MFASKLAWFALVPRLRCFEEESKWILKSGMLPGPQKTTDWWSVIYSQFEAWKCSAHEISLKRCKEADNLSHSGQISTHRKKKLWSNKRFMYGRDIHFGTNLLLIYFYITTSNTACFQFLIISDFFLFCMLMTNSKCQANTDSARHLQAAIALKSKRAIA